MLAEGGGRLQAASGGKMASAAQAAGGNRSQRQAASKQAAPKRQQRHPSRPPSAPALAPDAARVDRREVADRVGQVGQGRLPSREVEVGAREARLLALGDAAGRGRAVVVCLRFLLMCGLCRLCGLGRCCGGECVMCTPQV